MGFLSFLFAFASGALITFQAGSNSRLNETFGQPMPAVVVNSCLGLIAILAYTFASQVSWPSLQTMARAPWWAWFGGLFGALYSVAAVLLAKQMGAATLMGLVGAGQLVCSVILDHFGLVGFDVHHANVWRILGCGLMLAGMALIAKF
jgi:bacterial/archaeal transporter family-2 protein